MLEVGSIVGGRFRIERILGQGGMGVVAIATHLQLEQSVAIKVLHEETSENADLVARFLREAQASARLRSDHVCKVFDVGRFDDGAPYIVMELLEGSDLQGVIAAGALPIATAADYVLQACIAIAEAHARGIVHRDLKPANLFLTRRLDGSPLIKVLDFGIAKAPASGEFRITRTSTVMGSPGYMSPEQLRSAQDADARSDIWALGVILYELVTGRLPFRANSITELAVRVTVDPPEPIGIDAPGFAAIVHRCLEKSPDQRYPSIAALAADLAPLGGEVAMRSASLIAALAGAALTAGASGTATAPSSVVGTAPLVSGKATTLQTAAAQSTGDHVPRPVARRSRAGILVGGFAIAAVIAAIVVFVTRDRASTDSPTRPAAAATGSDGASGAGSGGGSGNAPGSNGAVVGSTSGTPGTGSAPTSGGAESAGGEASNAAVAGAGRGGGSAGAGGGSAAALRDKLRELAASRDWPAVLEVAELGGSDPEIAAIARDARKQYLAQQTRAIDAQVKLGNCARAREIAAAAHKIVEDDTTLEPRAKTCKPQTAQAPTQQQPTNPQPAHPQPQPSQPQPPTPQPPQPQPPQPQPPEPGAGAGSGFGTSANYDEAIAAMQHGDYARALSLAQGALQRAPRNPAALRMGVLAACHLKDEKTARALLRRLPVGRQRMLRQQCASLDVLL